MSKNEKKDGKSFFSFLSSSGGVFGNNKPSPWGSSSILHSNALNDKHKKVIPLSCTSYNAQTIDQSSKFRFAQKNTQDYLNFKLPEQPKPKRHDQIIEKTNMESQSKDEKDKSTGKASIQDNQSNMKGNDEKNAKKAQKKQNTKDDFIKTQKEKNNNYIDGKPGKRVYKKRKRIDEENVPIEEYVQPGNDIDSRIRKKRKNNIGNDFIVYNDNDDEIELYANGDINHNYIVKPKQNRGGRSMQTRKHDKIEKVISSPIRSNKENDVNEDVELFIVQNRVTSDILAICPMPYTSDLSKEIVEEVVENRYVLNQESTKQDEHSQENADYKGTSQNLEIKTELKIENELTEPKDVQSPLNKAGDVQGSLKEIKEIQEISTIKTNEMNDQTLTEQPDSLSQNKPVTLEHQDDEDKLMEDLKLKEKNCDELIEDNKNQLNIQSPKLSTSSSKEQLNEKTVTPLPSLRKTFFGASRGFSEESPLMKKLKEREKKKQDEESDDEIKIEKTERKQLKSNEQEKQSAEIEMKEVIKDVIKIAINGNETKKEQNEIIVSTATQDVDEIETMKKDEEIAVLDVEEDTQKDDKKLDHVNEDEDSQKTENQSNSPSFTRTFSVAKIVEKLKPVVQQPSHSTSNDTLKMSVHKNLSKFLEKRLEVDNRSMVQTKTNEDKPKPESVPYNTLMVGPNNDKKPEEVKRERLHHLIDRMMNSELLKDKEPEKEKKQPYIPPFFLSQKGDTLAKEHVDQNEFEAEIFRAGKKKKTKYSPIIQFVEKKLKEEDNFEDSFMSMLTGEEFTENDLQSFMDFIQSKNAGYEADVPPPPSKPKKKTKKQAGEKETEKNKTSAKEQERAKPKKAKVTIKQLFDEIDQEIEEQMREMTSFIEIDDVEEEDFEYVPKSTEVSERVKKPVVRFEETQNKKNQRKPARNKEANQKNERQEKIKKAKENKVISEDGFINVDDYAFSDSEFSQMVKQTLNDNQQIKKPVNIIEEGYYSDDEPTVKQIGNDKEANKKKEAIDTEEAVKKKTPIKGGKRFSKPIVEYFELSKKELAAKPYKKIKKPKSILFVHEPNYDDETIFPKNLYFYYDGKELVYSGINNNGEK